MTAPFQSDSTPFGDVLKHFRLTAGLTQEELAEQAGVSRLTISSLERGVRRVPHKDTLRRLTESLHLPPRDRFRLEVAGRSKGGGTQADGVTTSFGSSMASPLVGRDRELDVLENHIEGTGVTLATIAGEPGIGKTRLLQESAAYAALYGFRVIQGGCQRRRIQETYSPISSALAQYLAAAHPTEKRHHVVQSFPWLARLLPELEPYLVESLPNVSPEQEFRLITQDLKSYFAVPGTNGGCDALGTLLLLDDLQWATPDALELISAVVRSGQTPATSRAPLRLVVAYRDMDADGANFLSTTLADLLSSRLATHLPLSPLSDDDSHVLLHSLLLDASNDDLKDALDHSEGVPFFLIAYAQAIRAGEPGMPADVRRSIRSRMATLTDDALTILAIAPHLGSPAPHDALIELTGQTSEAFALSLAAIQRAGLLVPVTSGSSRFSYRVVRDVATEDLSTLLSSPMRDAIDKARTTAAAV